MNKNSTNSQHKSRNGRGADMTLGNVSGNHNSFVNGSSDVSISGEGAGLGKDILTVVPYIVHESSLAREERHVRRLIAALIISTITLLATNIGWLMFFSQYNFETTEISSEGGGNANYIGENGDIYNGSYQG